MSEKQAKYKTGAEKEICESEKDYPDLSEQGREYIEIIKADKLQLWDENKKLKRALDKAIGYLSADQCLYPSEMSIDRCPMNHNNEIKFCKECWRKYLMREGEAENGD